jgi:hypothetical protein
MTDDYVTVLQSEALKKCEQTLQRGLDDFAEAGDAFGRIFDEHLWSGSGYETFGQYCRWRWGISGNAAHRLRIAAKVAAIVPVQNLAQAGVLTSLLPDPGKLKDVWNSTMEYTDNDPSAKALGKTIRYLAIMAYLPHGTCADVDDDDE